MCFIYCKSLNLIYLIDKKNAKFPKISQSLKDFLLSSLFKLQVAYIIQAHNRPTQPDKSFQQLVFPTCTSQRSFEF